MTRILAFLAAALIAFGVIAQSPSPKPVTLQTPDGKQTVVLTNEACKMPEAPEGMYAARFDTDGSKYEGCWVFTTRGILIGTPEGKPAPRDDLVLTAKPEKQRAPASAPPGQIRT